MNIVLSKLLLAVGLIALAVIVAYSIYPYLSTPSTRIDKLGMILSTTLAKASSKGYGRASAVSFNDVIIKRYFSTANLTVFINRQLSAIGISNPVIYTGLININVYSFSHPNWRVPQELIKGLNILYNKSTVPQVESSPNYVILYPVIYATAKYSPTDNSTYINVVIYSIDGIYLVNGGSEAPILNSMSLSGPYNVYISVNGSGNLLRYSTTWIGPESNISVELKSSLWESSISNITEVAEGGTIYFTLEVLHVNMYLEPSG